MTGPASPTPTPSAGERRTARLLVLGQFVLLAPIVLLPHGDDWILPAAVARTARVAVWVGLVLMVLAATALGRGLTALPLPNVHAELRNGGLYRFVRHPIYSGLLLLAVALSLTSGSKWTAAACAALVVLINVKARWEERQLALRFTGYAGYAARTRRFIPGPTRR